MRRAALLLPLLVLAALPAPAGAATRSCGTVGFTPNSDDGAFGIRAENVGCRTARRVARASRRYGPRGEPGRVVRYTARGFTCVGRERDEGLASVRFRCRRGEARVRFTRS